ncbi:DUF3137 domain-containing protein [Herbiconiux sp. CPCC 205763]|uniref:DUF3137 domain-containing protein n=1 Tax=Herbiconiux aconitum TaxID=2970913 RepID=A0ABT2GS31_9MICO|nr:DUF3137 domain-containing protein [Herbiconiux aconitum]MCS5719036.1 DUF3137 domain-containing protein [Herbiconiux aconitum]
MNEFDLSGVRGRPKSWERLLASTWAVWLLRLIAAALAVAIASILPPTPKRAYAALAIASAGVFAVEAARRVARARREARLNRLAAANGLTYLRAGNWTESSALIYRARNCRTSDEFRSADANGSVRIGTLSLDVERAGTFVTENWGFTSQLVAGASLPHIMLVSRDPRSRSLPASFDPKLKMTLEGDFPKYFDLYCTPDAKLDTLYLLTPDLMASLVDNAGFSSMEFTGNRVFFFTPGRFDPDDRTQWERSLRLLSSVGADSLKRVQRLNRVGTGRDPLDQRRASASSARERPRLRLSIGRSNRSTQLVEAVCATVVAGALLWAWLH